MTAPNRTNGTAVARREDSPAAALKHALARYAPSLEKVLPRHLTPDRVVSLTLLAATKSPELYRCSPESIAMALMRISQWGLEIGTTAHLVAFGDQCTPIADYCGLIELAIRAGQVRKVDARVVRDGDHFDYELGLDERLVHRPTAGSDAPITHVYAIASLPRGEKKLEVMTRDEVEAIRRAARSGNSPAWKNHFGEMARKTVVRRLLKQIPLNPALAEVMRDEERIEAEPLDRFVSRPRIVSAGEYDESGVPDDARLSPAQIASAAESSEAEQETQGEGDAGEAAASTPTEHPRERADTPPAASPSPAADPFSAAAEHARRAQEPKKRGGTREHAIGTFPGLDNEPAPRGRDALREG